MAAVPFFNEGDAITVTAIAPQVDAGGILAGAQFSDAYTILVDGRRLDARGAAERMFGRMPRWIAPLMAIRDRIVAPFGIKTAREISAPRSIGFFPVVSESAHRLVVGLDDRHLDFRVVVDVAPAGRGRRVTATTIVLTHGRLGRCYLAAILPFHRRIVRAMLAQVI
jgi:hypothetical protein